MLKKKNNEMLTQKDLQNIHHKEIMYRFLQNDDVEFLGISSLKKYKRIKHFIFLIIFKCQNKKYKEKELKMIKKLFLQDQLMNNCSI